jgi:hypothetical protein
VASVFGLDVCDPLSRKAPAIAFDVDFTGGRMGKTYFLRIFESDGKVFAKISKRLKERHAN